MKVLSLANGSGLVVEGWGPEDSSRRASDAQVEWLGEGDEFDISAFKARISAEIAKDGDRQRSDGVFAEIVHESLPITRRQATESGVWHHLTLFAVPEYVDWRWGGNGEVARPRQLGTWTRNAVGRLWWLAELTKTDGDRPYSRTVAAAGSQEFILWLLDTLVSSNPRLVKALVDRVFDPADTLPDAVIKPLLSQLAGLTLMLTPERVSDERLKEVAEEHISAIRA